MSNHTPGPWFAHQRDWVLGHFSITNKESTGNPKWDIARTWEPANAEFIVKACNAHDDLLEACKEALAERYLCLSPLAYDASHVVAILAKAIAKAEGKE